MNKARQRSNTLLTLRILMIIEGILVLLVAVSFFFRHRVYEYTTDMFFSEVTAPTGGIKESERFVLPAGSYRISVYYSSDADMSNTCDIVSDKLDARCLATNGVQFFRGLHKTDFDMWLYRNADDLRLVSEYHGPGDFSVQGFSIQETNAFRGMALFWIFAGALCVNAGYLCYKRNQDQPYSREDKIIFVDRKSVV